MVKPSVVIAVLAMIFVVSEADDRGSFVGGRSPVKDVKSNEEVQDVGRFSVKEFNRVRSEQGKMKGGELEFSQVVEAQVQVVAGLKYYMLVEAVQNNETKAFESEVVVQPWLQSRQLLRFEPSKGLRVRR